MVVTLALPPEANGLGYIQAIQKLPKFGRAGLPLIKLMLQDHHPGLANVDATFISALLYVQAEVLGQIAKNDDLALKMLLAMPKSRLAIKWANPNLEIGIVGRQLLSLAIARPETRKEMVPYFVAFLANGRSPGEREYGAKVLGEFGPAAASALPILTNARLDQAEAVRNAVREAIAKIEEGKK